MLTECPSLAWMMRVVDKPEEANMEIVRTKVRVRLNIADGKARLLSTEEEADGFDLDMLQLKPKAEIIGQTDVELIRSRDEKKWTLNTYLSRTWLHCWGRQRSLLTASAQGPMPKSRAKKLRSTDGLTGTV